MPRPEQFKCIHRAADLAINGAPPAFSTPLHVGRPNIGDQKRYAEVMAEMFGRRWLSNDGPLVQELERRIEAYLGVKHCIAMCNGTIALEIAIRALGLSGEVIVPSWTFVATAHALHWQGITPVFADIDSQTHNLDPESVRRVLTPRTTGIIGVHLWGRAAPTEALQEVADEHGLQLMFDAAHAFGCSNTGRMIGGFGRVEVLSFHATKFFNTFEGGAALTNDDELAQTMRLMRNFGFSGLDNVIHPGTNGKMIEPCAAMGLVNLDNLQAIVEVNRRNHDAYAQALQDIQGVKLLEFDLSEQNNFQYVVLQISPDTAFTRDHLVEALHAENILARRYFWPGCHRMQPYRALFPNAGLLLPVTERIARQVVVLPTGSSLPEYAPEVIADVIRTLAGPA